MVAGNQTFPIYNSDGSSFNGLELKKSVYDSVVMSLGDKITGDVYYQNNALVVTMKEYIIYNGVKFVLVNPPTIVREGMVSDNGELKGMTKYSFTFYHPMYMLGNFPLCDVAVSSDQQRYLSESKTFFWIGNLTDFVAKLNKNLENTEWYCTINDSVSQGDRQRLSDVMSFDKNTIADALKTGYETWDVPYIISIIPNTSPLYQQGKRFLIQYGLPSTEILVKDSNGNDVPFVFRFGQGVGLKNNSRTPRNNKIVTRIAGYGSENNIQYGYPQIPYEGGDCEYPLYYGIVNGKRVQLIKHPFTRNHLMPSIYRETVNKKVNPMADGYNPDIEIIDYYDADSTYENPIKPLEPSYEIHEFENIKPELGKRSVVGVSAYSNKDLDSISLSSFLSFLSEYHTETEYLKEKEELEKIINTIGTMSSNSGSVNTRAYYCDWAFTKDERYAYVKFESSALNFEYTVLMVSPSQDVEWDDTMDDDGKYVQSYFKITIPQLAFDLYASAAITQEMTINMRSGACLGCSFPVMVDWDDYKLNFFDSDGNFAPDGEQRDYDKYPDSSKGQIDLVLQKETSTFGTLMPNIYQKPKTGDEFVILGISLPTTYITEAEARLDAEMKQYMRDNNVYYFDYPLKFDEHFLTTHEGILEQMDNNVIVRFDYAGTEHALYIKQVSVKYDNKPLPTYDITLTDNIEVVLNQIGQVVDEVRRLHDNIGGIEVQPSDNYIRKDIDDTAYGTISLIKGLQVGNRFVTGLLGEGGVFRKEEDGTTYLECDKMYVRMKAYFDTVEVRHYMHSAGNRVASSAGIKCSRVEYIDANGDVTQDASNAQKYRCYFRANDDGQEVRNDFVVGDLAFCKETNAQTDSIEQHGYWRAVVGRNTEGVLTNDGEGWIDLSVSDCMQGSDIPIAQDDIIQLGNKTDTDRQGAIVEFVSGADAPSYQIYQGINDYSLNGKNYVRLGYDSASGGAQAYIGNPDGSTYLWYHNVTEESVTFPRLDIKANVRFTSPTTHQETTIQDFVGAVTSDIESLQSQIDGAIETWFYEHIPQLSNAPASDWKTDTEKKNHLGDLFYNTETGYGYRFANTGTEQSPVFGWIRITDTDVVKALADAAKAQDTADHKRRVFLTKPTPPYDAGDMWVNAVWPASGESQGSTYNNDILRCKTAKTSTQNFSINDWGLASKYTDDSALNYFIENTYAQDVEIISTQIDKKAETWYQDGDPSDAWTTDELKSEHVGDIWCDTSSNGGKKTWIYRDRGEGRDNRYYWAEQSVPDDVFDQIDGKKTIYIYWNDTSASGGVTGAMRNGTLQVRDLFIPNSNITKGYIEGTSDSTIKYAKNKVYRCTEVGAYSDGAITTYPTFVEIAYTDDTALNNFKENEYVTQLTNGTISQSITNAATAAANAEAHATTLDYVKTALKQDTVIDGGLVISTLLALRDGNNRIWSGINGAYKSAETGSGYKGHGIAAWYGGAMVDKEVTTTATDYAKSLFRFDGSGYVAGGNLSWDKNGNVTLQGESVNATTLKANGSAVATESMLANYLPLSAGSDKKLTGTLYAQNVISKTDGTYNLGTSSYYWKNLYVKRIYLAADVYLEYDSTNTSVKLNGSLYATGGVSALGAGSGGSSGGGDVTWALLASSSDTRQIALSHLTTALSGYATQSWVTQQISAYKPDLSGYVTIGTSQTITGVKTFSGTIAPNGGITPLAANTTTTPSGGGKVWFKKATSRTTSGDDTLEPNNGVIIEYGDSTEWTGQLYLGDNATQGLYWNGWSNGVRGEWKKFAFTDEIVSNIGNGSITNAMLAGSIANDKLAYCKITVNGTEISLGENKTTTKWGESRNINIASSDGSGVSTSVGVDGSKAVTLKLPSTIKASLTGNADTATTATKLSTISKKAWGQTYWTSGGVPTTISGLLSSVSGIKINSTGSGYGYIDFHYASAQTFTSNIFEKQSGQLAINSLLYVTKGGNVGIGTYNPSTLLHVNGYTRTNRLYLTDSIYLEYDSENKGVHLVNAGFYADTFVSALGKSDDGGASTFDESQMWTALGTNITTKKIKQSYLDLTGYVQTSALSAYMKGVKVNGTSYTTKDANGIVDLGEIKADISNLVTLSTAQTITGAKTFSGSIATNGGITPLGVGTVNTASGGSKVYFKRVDNTEAPNNGVVIEYGNSTSWVGQLYLGDNATQGLYWNGWSNGVRGEWKKFAFTDEIVSNIGNGSITNVMLANNSVTINGTSVNLGGSVTTTKWGTARSITISDNSGTNTQANTGIDGSTDFTLKLPSTIKASLTGNVTGNVTGNADTATTATTANKLSVKSKTAWGRTYWTSDGVPTTISGLLSSVSGIKINSTGSGYGYIDFHYASAQTFTSNIFEKQSGQLAINSLLYVTKGGNVGIGTYNPSTLLHVNGYTRTNRLYLTDSIYLEYDSENKGVHLVNAGFYADTFVSALGKGDDGGASTFDESQMWTALGTNITTKKIKQSYLDLTGYVQTSALSAYMKGVKVNGTSYTTKDANGIVDLGEIKPDLSNYLPLTGGTLTGNLTINHNNGLVVQTNTGSKIIIKKDDGALGEFLGVNVHDAKNNYTTGIFYYYTGNKNIVFGTHSTNMLDFYGQNAVFYTGTSYTGDSGMPYTERMRILKSGNVNIGDTPSADPGVKLNVDGDVKATKFIGALQGNADSATTASKLSVVSKKAWGQTYWTSGGIPTTISGNMTNVGSITMSGALSGATTISASSDVSVGGTLSVTGLLTASGGITIPSGKTLQIGDAVLSWDATNQGIKITKGLYSETFISAYGRGADSGAATSLSSLSDVNISGVANGMALVYRSGTWRAETISSGTSGNYLPLSGGTMTGNIITPANNSLGIRPASNNYGQIGTSSYKFYRMYASNMYASTFYGELDGTISDETRGSLITSNNEFNFVPQVYTKDDLHFNYKAANGELCNRTITTYCFDDGKKNTLCSITSSGASAGSDIRKKDVKEYFRLSLDNIVSAPLIRFSWKNMNDKSLQVGSIAQYWKDVLPESVIEGTDGYLFMNDAKVALACSISLASNVQDHERRIAELEKENERLRTEIEQLKVA